ncbi:MAG: hypothetical protein GX574_05565 [Lentisphaerae bacterium]|nr:hypothetical protein [Lentisphaerota bacterium]
MRRYLLFCFLAAGLSITAETLRHPITFSEGLPGWWTNSKLFAVAAGERGPELVITGDQEQEKGYQRLLGLVKELSAEQLTGQTWNMSFQALIPKLTGAVKVEVRQIGADDKSVSYNTIRLRQFDQAATWQTFSLECKMSPKTVKIGIYITADFLASDDQVRIRQFVLTKP